MRIDRVELDGFGWFTGRHWDLNGGMTVLLGANEAGKTTLLNAIRALLFGFESTREGRTWYPALAGGRRGGRLSLRMRDGERWTVERHGERGGTGALIVEAPNGNRGGQDELNRLLGGADRDLFNNIFAFGLGELEAFASLSGDGVRSRIYGAGSGMGGTSVLDIERRLRADQDSAYRPRGQEQALARLLGRMEELRTRIAELEREPADYEAARAELVELRRRRAATREERMAAAVRREHLRRLLEAQAPAGRLAVLEREMAAADPRLDSLSPGAEATLDRLLAEQLAAEQSLATLDASIDATERRRAAVSFDPAVLAAAAEIDTLRDERVSHAERAGQLVAANDAATSLVAELGDQLRRVGDWTEDQLLAIDDSIATVEGMREQESRLAGTSAAVERLADRLEAARRELATAEDELVPGELDDRELAARRDALAALADLRVETAMLEERERLKGRATAALPAWLTSLAGGLLVLLAGTLLGTYLDLQPAGSLAATVAGAALAAWLLLRDGAAPPETHRQALSDRRAELLLRAGLPPDADGERIRATADELAAEQAAMRSSVQRHARLDERRAAMKRLGTELQDARSATAAANDAWRAWLGSLALPPGLTPETARQVVATVAVGRRLVRERDAQLARAAAAADGSASYEARLDALLARLGRQIPTDASLRPATVVALAEERQQAAEDQRRARDLDATLEEQRARRAPLESAFAVARERLTSLLSDSGVSSVEELRALASAAVARGENRHEARELTATLVALAGSEDAVPPLREEAASTDPARLAAEREAASAAASRLEEQESEALTREGELRGEIVRLEQADDLGIARQQLAMARSQAEAEARRWAVRAVALALLAETRRRYERERQPQVVRDAERYFAAITDGRYTRIVAPPGEANVRVEPETGSARGTDELSRGTAEQLYLALRFGLIEQFARSAESLPVVMDDILVNFDRERAGRAARAIRDLATRHQVVFFTCHPLTAELLDPDGVATLDLG